MINSHIESFAKYAGIATVSVEWLALLLYYIRMPAYFGGIYPLSYFAYLPQTRLVFTLCYTLAGIFFWIFIKYRIHNHYPTPLKILGLSILLFIALALFPFNPYNVTSNFIHSLLGLGSAILFVIGFAIMAKNTNNRTVRSGTIITLILSLVFFAAFMIVPKGNPFLFAFEAGSWLVIQLWVIWISFYIHKNPLLKEKD